MKILVTGGHITPALAVIDELKSHEVVFVGRKYSEGKPSFEYEEISQRGVKFYDLQAGRLTRILSLRTLLNIALIPFGFMQGLIFIIKERPDVVLSFGGYLAFPIAFWAWILRISLYTHEQTLVPGLANRLIGRWAKKVFISFNESRKYFGSAHVVLTGNPVRTDIFQVRSKLFNFKKNKPVIYVTGGSLGSHSINEHIESILKPLLERYFIIHQVGDTRQYHDFEDLEKIRGQLPANLAQSYFIKKHFLAAEIGFVYSQADLVISRSGANTFFELMALEKPAILIPLPWSAHGEQQKQAQEFKEFGVGEVFDQSAPVDKLLELINSVVRNLARYKDNFKHLKITNSKNAAKKIIAEITAL